MPRPDRSSGKTRAVSRSLRPGLGFATGAFGVKNNFQASLNTASQCTEVSNTMPSSSSPNQILVTVSVSFCCVTSHPELLWLKITTVFLGPDSEGCLGRLSPFLLGNVSHASVSTGQPAGWLAKEWSRRASLASGGQQAAGRALGVFLAASPAG